jgi:hypothetical protein
MSATDTTAQQRLELATLDVPQRDVQLCVDLSRVVDRDDIGVLQRGGQLGLGQKALTEKRILGQLGGDQLDREGALQAQVIGPIDDPHPAAARERLDPIAEELGPDAGSVEAGLTP